MKNFSRSNAHNHTSSAVLYIDTDLYLQHQLKSTMTPPKLARTHAQPHWITLCLATTGIWFNINNRRRPAHTRWERHLSSRTIGKCVLLVCVCRRNTACCHMLSPREWAKHGFKTTQRRAKAQCGQKVWYKVLSAVTNQSHEADVKTHMVPLKPVQKQTNRLLEKQSSSCDPQTGENPGVLSMVLIQFLVLQHSMSNQLDWEKKKELSKRKISHIHP